MRKTLPRILILSLLLIASGCEKRAGMMLMDMAPPPPGSKLAVEHEVVVDVSDDQVVQAHQAALDACAKDTANRCTVLGSSVNHGDYASAELRARILPEGVAPLISVAMSFGELRRRSTKAEDLAKPILDTDKRIAMQEAYLKDLLVLRQQSRHEVDALIRVAGEIAKVQSELDAAKANLAQLSQRVDTQILTINFYSERLDSFSAPIGAAFSAFGEDLGSGIASAISGVAYILPWLLIIIPLLYGLRWLWRRRR